MKFRNSELMEMVLIDTNIISEFMRREPDPLVMKWASKNKGFALSVITIEELHFGLTRQGLPLKRQWLDAFVEAQCQLLPVSAVIAITAGNLRGELALNGITRHQADLLIASTALTHQIPLATRNTKDFEHCGIDLINPFLGD